MRGLGEIPGRRECPDPCAHVSCSSYSYSSVQKQTPNAAGFGVLEHKKEVPQSKGKSKATENASAIVDLFSPRRSKLSFEYSITTEPDEDEHEDEDCKTEGPDDEHMSVVSANLSVTDPLDGLSFETGEPEGSSTPR